MNRKHLANMRVVQKNLVYVVGLSSKLAKEEVSCRALAYRLAFHRLMLIPLPLLSHSSSRR